VCPQDSTKRSRPGHCGSAGLCRITRWNNRYAAGARLIAVPGCPFPVFCTASAASTRMVSTARESSSVQPSGVIAVSVTGRAGSFRCGLVFCGYVEPIGERIWRTWDRPTSKSPGECQSSARALDFRLVTTIDVSARIATEDGARRVRSATLADPDARTSEFPRLADVLGAYVGLTKPRIIELLLVTTVPAMFLAARGVPDLILVLSTMVGGCLAAASANVFNCVLDRDIDERMRRTRRRPLPRHAVGPLAATVFGVVLGVAATLWLGFFVNWLSALLALAANAFYVFVYTLWLKRRTSQNIVWGGIAGCFPPLIGWTAVSGSIDLAPFVLFAIVFCWTPPHTWALAMRYREDYQAANVPMLPVVRSAPAVTARILLYALATVGISLVLWPVAETGWLYPIVAAVAGAVLVWESLQLLSRANAGLRDAALRPMRLFHWSNSYLALVFVAAAVSPLLT
jgi:heme o synthase